MPRGHKSALPSAPPSNPRGRPTAGGSTSRQASAAPTASRAWTASRPRPPAHSRATQTTRSRPNGGGSARSIGQATVRVLQRISLDRVPHQVDACYPADNQEMFTRLRHAALFHDVVNLRERPVNAGGAVLQAAAFGVETQPLSHSVPTIGYRLVEEDGRRILPAR